MTEPPTTAEQFAAFFAANLPPRDLSALLNPDTDNQTDTTTEENR